MSLRSPLIIYLIVVGESARFARADTAMTALLDTGARAGRRGGLAEWLGQGAMAFAAGETGKGPWPVGRKPRHRPAQYAV